MIHLFTFTYNHHGYNCVTSQLNWKQRKTPQLQKNVMTTFEPQALFFDFDGVLVDSTKIKTSAFKELFSTFGDDVINRILDYHKRHGGISRVDKIKYAFENIMKVPLSEKEHLEYSKRYSEIVVEDVIQANWVKGAKNYLKEMHTRVPIFVISGTPGDELRYVIEKRGMSHYFKEILGSPVKKPVHVRNLLRQYKLQPRRCVFIGDALTDYDAAMATGLHFVGIFSEVDFPAGVRVLPDCSGLQRAVETILPNCRKT